jgi:hypothetical protein
MTTNSVIGTFFGIEDRGFESRQGESFKELLHCISVVVCNLICTSQFCTTLHNLLCLCRNIFRAKGTRGMIYVCTFVCVFTRTVFFHVVRAAKLESICVSCGIARQDFVVRA